MKKLVLEGGKFTLKDRKLKTLEKIKISPKFVYKKANEDIRILNQSDPLQIPYGSKFDYGLCGECGEKFYNENQQICERCGAELNDMPRL